MVTPNRPARLVACLAIASVAYAAPLEGQERFPDTPPAHGLYSAADRVGDLVFLSGVVSGADDPTTQFRQVFARIGQTTMDIGGPNWGMITIQLKPREERERSATELMS